MNVNFSVKLNRLICIQAVFFLFSCASITERKVVHKSIYQLMNNADSLFISGNKSGAYLFYNQLMGADSISQINVQHIRSRGAYLHILAKDTNGILGYIKELHQNATLTNKEELLNQALLFKTRGDLKKYHELLISLKKFQAFNETDSLVMSRVFAELGAYFRNVNMVVDSSEYYLQAALNYTRHQWNRVPILWKLSDLNIIKRDYLSGLNHVSMALSDIDKSTNSKLLTGLYKNKALLLRKQSRIEEALSFLESILNKSNVLLEGDKAVLLEELTRIYLLQNADKQALNSIKKLEELHQELVDVNRIKGEYFRSTGDFEKTLYHYSLHYEKLEKVPFPDLVLIYQAFDAMIWANNGLGNYDESLKLVFSSLVYETKFNGRDFSWEILQSEEVAAEENNFYILDQVAEVILRKNRKKQHFQELKQVSSLLSYIDSVATFQIGLGEESIFLEFAKINNSIYNHAIEANYLLFQEGGQFQYLEKIWDYTERNKGWLLSRDLLNSSERKSTKVPEEFMIKGRNLAVDIAFLQQLNEKQSYVSLELVNQLDSLIREQKLYFQKIKIKYPLYYHAQIQRVSPTLSNAQQLVDFKNLSVLQYHEADEYFYSILLRPSMKAVVARHPRDLNLETQLKTFSECLRSSEYSVIKASYVDFVRAGSSLFKLLIPEEARNENEVVIIPDGELNQLPFGALLKSEVGLEEKWDYRLPDYWEKTSNIHYLSTFKTVQAESVALPQNPSILGIAYSEKGLEANETDSLPEISGSWKEIDYLEKLIKNEKNTFHKGKQSTKATFETHIEKPYDIIHLATHATSSLTSRLDNKIYFRQAAKIDSLNTLYGYELLTREISAKLVVLSACETASGEERKGEGTYSLSRAFIQSGADNVIASLWKQADGSASNIQMRFYEQLNSGNSIKASLHKARLDYLNTASEVNAHPFYWAGIVGFGWE